MRKQEGSSNDGKPQNKASKGLAKNVAWFVRVTFHESVTTIKCQKEITRIDNKGDMMFHVIRRE